MIFSFVTCFSYIKQICQIEVGVHIIIIWIGVQFRALPPGSTAVSVAYCTIPRFLNVLTLVARFLSRPQLAVVP